MARKPAAAAEKPVEKDNVQDKSTEEAAAARAESKFRRSELFKTKYVASSNHVYVHVLIFVQTAMEGHIANLHPTRGRFGDLRLSQLHCGDLLSYSGL